jgi:hypothetical protein
MQRVVACGAEACCLNKIRNNGNDNVSVNTPDCDVEKASIKPSDSPVTKESVIETGNPSNQNGNGIFEQNRASDSDASTLAADEEKDDFPEGGLRGWSVVVGSFCGSFSVFGIINSTAILLEYFSTHQLKDYTPSQIGWIFGLSLFLTFFCGAPIGPIFDAYGPRVLVFCGSVLLVASMFLLGLCTRKCPYPISHISSTDNSTEYWHFFLVYSVLNGLGGCLIYPPCIASIGHFFLVKRGNATGKAYFHTNFLSLYMGAVSRAVRIPLSV